MAVQVTGSCRPETPTPTRACTRSTTGAAPPDGGGQVEGDDGGLSLARRLDVGRTGERRRRDGGGSRARRRSRHTPGSDASEDERGDGAEHARRESVEHVRSASRCHVRATMTRVRSDAAAEFSILHDRSRSTAGRRRRASRSTRRSAAAAAACRCAIAAGACPRRARGRGAALGRALPPHVAGIFCGAGGVPTAAAGGYLVFDRRGHTVYRVDAALTRRRRSCRWAGGRPHHPAGSVRRVVGRSLRRSRRAGGP